MIISSKLAPLKSSKVSFQQPDFDLARLESSLRRENNKQKVEQSQPITIIPDYEKAPLEDKLWKFFLSRVESIKLKVQKERVNIWTREMDSISNQVIKKTEANKSRLSSLQTLIRSKHHQIHDLYQEMRLVPLSLKEPSKKEDDLIASKNISQTCFLQKQIDILKGQVDELTKQQENTEQELEKISREYVSFVCQLLKNEYYREDGIRWMVQQLLEAGYEIREKQLPQVLSREAKEYVLKQARAGQRGKNSGKREAKAREREGCQQALGRTLSLLEPNQLKKVYSKAQDCMGELLRQPAWRDTLTLPRLCPQPPNVEELPLSHSAACKALLHSYLDLHTQKRARALLIGSKVPLLP